ncbi:MAG: hypothetical protein LV480_01445 [Methylacidiphilales bacterium]|nr:hypothetical protein [Candidatus Methylacidiphilales bacterium]
MSTAEILEELPKLTPSDLELVYARAAELQLKAVFDEADAAFEKEGGVSLAEARRALDFR